MYLSQQKHLIQRVRKIRREGHIIELYKNRENLASVPLDFVCEWHPTLNGELTPEMLKPQSNKKVWWRCTAFHEWQASVQRRFLGDDCPYCNGKKVTLQTSLKAKFPELANEWHNTKNEQLTPGDVFSSSAKKVWWQCSCGNEWQARIDHRSGGSGCPLCRRKRRTKSK